MDIETIRLNVYGNIINLRIPCVDKSIEDVTKKLKW